MTTSKQTIRIFVFTVLVFTMGYGIGSTEIKDTYFNRFFYQSIISGGSTPGKYNLDYNMGRENLTWGILADFPLNASFIPWDNVSQAGGMFIYKFEDNFGTGLAGEKDTVMSTSLTALNIAYGWNIYQLPFNTNLFGGLNLYLGSERKLLKGAFTEEKTSIFSVAPYFYFINPWSSTITTQADVMVSHDYKDLSKLALKVLLNRQNWDVKFTTERNGTEFNDSYENSVSILKDIPSIWWFKNIGGLIYKPLKEMDESDPEVRTMMDDMDKLFGKGAGYFIIKAGSSFDVNNIAGEKFSDKLGKADNYFVKAEGGFIFVTGLSYRIENGLGFKLGFNYGLNFNELNRYQGNHGGPATENAGWINLSDKNLFVALELMRNYINDDLFGLRIDPGTMLRINLAIR